MTMRKWFPAVVIVTAFAMSLAAYPHLPDRVPLHWGLDGQPNGWVGLPVGPFALPLAMIALVILFRVLPDADPRKSNYEKFWGTYDFIVIGVVTFCFAIHCVSLGQALGLPIPMERVVPALIGAFFIGLGNVFPRLRSNWWVGIRTPWSMSSDENWARTQRIGGYLFVAAGVLLLVDATAPGHWMNRIAIGAAIALPMCALVVSYAASLISE
jgi:immunity protein, SdpI family